MNQEFDKYTVEHLRMLQSIINRMANTSLSIKRYSLMIFTFVSTYLVIKPIHKDIYLLMLSTFIFIMMILFDMYYLYMEQLYIKKYNNDRKYITDEILFDLSIPKTRFIEIIKVIKSKSILLFYIPLLFVMYIIFIII